MHGDGKSVKEGAGCEGDDTLRLDFVWALWSAGSRFCFKTFRSWTRYLGESVERLTLVSTGSMLAWRLSRREDCLLFLNTVPNMTL